MTFKVVYYNDLPLEAIEGSILSNNGSGKEWAHYLLAYDQNDKFLWCESDAMEPEDATFGRNLSWIKTRLAEAYKQGWNDSYHAFLSDSKHIQE